MSKYLKRVTESKRGQAFNALSWPFLLTLFVYGFCFAFMFPLGVNVGGSLAFIAMANLNPSFPLIWGVTALFTMFIGATFLLFNIPASGKTSGLLGFALWLFVGIAYVYGGEWLALFAFVVPQMYFWIWQYLSLSVFSKEDKEDKQTMIDYDAGRYDDELNPKDSRAEREDNRGVDRQ